MVGFFKQGNIYKVTRMTGNRDNILGISFAGETNGDDSIEVVEWYFPSSDRSQIRTSKEEVLQQVLAGLKAINEALGTDYQISKIYYVPSEDGSGSMYTVLIDYLILHYHDGNEFQESKPKAQVLSRIDAKQNQQLKFGYDLAQKHFDGAPWETNDS